jgi:PIN domain nuclease of toxin-antitoxin system
VNLLLDTHVFLWWMAASRRLTKQIRDAIADPDHYVAVSAASVWEITIKQALGKLEAPSDVPSALRANDFEPLPITVDHASLAGALPRHHEDPFDRMLIAQSMLEHFTLVTHDRRFDVYGVPVLQA